ncbi:hypothetical protein K8T06_01200 [bacterium]|nr:hypothetical protein [bacterium]
MIQSLIICQLSNFKSRFKTEVPIIKRSGNNRENGEFQLTSCLDQLRQEDGFDGFIVDGERFDMGLPEDYRDTILRFPGT